MEIGAVENGGVVGGEVVAGKRGKKPQGWKCMPFIIATETFEKVATIGVVANLTVYLVKRFNIGQIEAANITNIFFGTLNFAPLLGAFISDAYLGRFKTLAYGCFASLLGMLGMTLSASLPALKPPICHEKTRLGGGCNSPSTLQLSELYLSLGFLIIGGGAIRPCSLPFGVDQFDKTDEEGRKGLNSYYNWYYGTSTAALVLSMTVIIYIQNNVSWPIGFGIPTLLMFLAIIMLFLGTNLYVHVQPEGSIFAGIAQVLVASFKKRNLKLPCPHDINQQGLILYNPPSKGNRVFRLPLTSQFRFLNKGAIVMGDDINVDGSARNSWELCNVQQIEEVKCLIRIVPVCISGVLCFVALAQQFTYIILQTFTMDCHFGTHFEIPAGSVVSISLIALTLFIPIYDRILVPIARRFTGVESGITLLQRQGIGLAISPISMVVAGLVERKRRNSALSNGGRSPMSVLWLAPQLVLMGIAEAFNAVGQIEFYNKQFPENMQTLAGSLFFCTIAGANYLSTALANIMRKVTTRDGHSSWLTDNINLGKLDYYFYFIALMGVLNLIYFLICSHFYQYKVMSLHSEESIKVPTKEEEATEIDIDTDAPSK
ncbi:protein NRT1/ PTR FAMILY 2.13-like [Oryza glaberrima]|nr:protein NRT1/ PTR FAMILY 2.13-like [Oryza glaberrima]